MKHGATCPRMCSQCAADVVVRKVTTDGPIVLVDGVPVRQVELEAWSPGAQKSRERGGNAHGRRRQG